MYYTIIFQRGKCVECGQCEQILKGARSMAEENGFKISDGTYQREKVRIDSLLNNCEGGALTLDKKENTGE